MPVIKLSKEKYSADEHVEFEIKNDEKNSIFVFPVFHNELIFQGEVFSNGKKIETFDNQGSATSKAEYAYPERIEIKSGKSLNGKWSGRAFRLEGKDKINDWKPYSPTGKFRIKLFYWKKKEGGEKLEILSGEFSVSGKGVLKKIFGK